MDVSLRERVEHGLEQLAQLLRAHAGGIDLVDISSAGTVRVRLTGMCAGCPIKPVTMTATIRPALLSLSGVKAVECEGARISEEAEIRLLDHLVAYGSPVLLNALDVNGPGWIGGLPNCDTPFSVGSGHHQDPPVNDLDLGLDGQVARQSQPAVSTVESAADAPRGGDHGQNG